MQSIAKGRATATDRAYEKQRTKNSSIVSQSLKSKDSGALAAFDQASSEVEVIHSELQRYMMHSALEMFQKETSS